jgi:hypothetical protein
MSAERALTAQRRLGPADGCAEVHHRLDEIAGSTRRHRLNDPGFDLFA